MNLHQELSELFRADEGGDVMRQHREAMKCRDVELALGIGVLCFQSLRHRHDDWFSAVENKHVPYRIEDAESFAEEYRQWLKAADYWLARADEFAAEGYDVEHREQLRRYRDDLSTIQLDVRASLAALGRLEAGEGLSLDEFFDGRLHDKD
jgi:hypothetical protein